VSGCGKNGAQVVLQAIELPEKITVSVSNNTGTPLSPVFTPAVFSSIPVVWSTTDNSVVTVMQDGTIYGLKPGTAWVKIKDKNSATTGKCLVTVE
jgi:uncharacterized protein YjdB